LGCSFIIFGCTGFLRAYIVMKIHTNRVSMMRSRPRTAGIPTVDTAGLLSTVHRGRVPDAAPGRDPPWPGPDGDGRAGPAPATMKVERA
jgi:hypothetical protein